MLCSYEQVRWYTRDFPTNDKRLSDEVCQVGPGNRGSILICQQSRICVYWTSEYHTGEGLVCVPYDSLQHGMPTLRNKIMSEVHEGFTAMHLGSNRSEYEIRRHADWPRIRKDIHACSD